ncbi:MAG: hypothetical protein LHW41_08340 [Candidatus Cloacimonetes bacterium]|nr:hypothetical protein [Candidatus Cloacimonadota bacterium]
MKNTVEEIRKMLMDGLFTDEQHIRFSLVGRICQKLGWDIWNPAEFYTEYPVNPTLPPPGQKQVFSAYFSALKDKYYENYIFINDCKRTD